MLRSIRQGTTVFKFLIQLYRDKTMVTVPIKQSFYPAPLLIKSLTLHSEKTSLSFIARFMESELATLESLSRGLWEPRLKYQPHPVKGFLVCGFKLFQFS